MLRILFTVCLFSVLNAVYSKCEGGLKEYNLPDGIKCCKKTRCLPGYEIKPCSEDGGSDTCKPCDNGLKQPDKIISDLTSPCSKPKCPPESVLDNTTSPPRCRCDEERGYTGDDPDNCKKLECREKTYLKDGECKDCPVGTERPGVGVGRCTPSVKSAPPSKPNTAPGVIGTSTQAAVLIGIVVLITIYRNPI